MTEHSPVSPENEQAREKPSWVKPMRFRDAAEIVDEAASDLSYGGTEDDVEDFLAVARKLRQMATRLERT